MIKNKFLFPIFFIGFAYSFYISLFIPIYGDEFDWKLIGSRFFADQMLVWVFPSCLKGFWLEIPLTWYPYLLFESLIYQGAHRLDLLRLLGCVFYLIIIALNTRILMVLSGLGFFTSFLTVASFFSLGVLPFSMVLIRPEQELSLLVCFSILLFLMLKNSSVKNRSLLFNVLILGLFCLIGNFIVVTHPKGIFFLPIIATSYWLICRLKKFFLIFIISCLAVTYQTMALWSSRTLCEENTWLNFKNLTLNPGQLLQNPIEFIGLFSTNIKNSFLYIKYIFFKDQYQSSWLPIDPEFQMPLNIMMAQGINILILSILIIVFISFLLSLRHMFGSKNNLNSIILCSIAISILLISGMQTGKNFYEANWFWVLIFLMFIFSVDFNSSPTKVFFKKYILTFLIILSLISSSLRIFQFNPSLPSWKALTNGYSVVTSFSFKNNLREFSKEHCMINESSTALVLETLTYPSFWNQKKPYFITFLTGWWGTGTNYPEIIRGANSGGMILQCQNIPPEYSEFAKYDGMNFCCVSADNIQKVTTIKK